jgi:hypothetical protein
VTKKKEKQPRGYKQWLKKHNAEFRKKLAVERKKHLATTTLEQRRAFIGFMHEGMALGAAHEKAGISFDAACEVYRRSVKCVKHYYLLPVEGVK